MFLTYVGLFRNTTLNFTSNLGHEGLRCDSREEYKSLFAIVGSAIVSLQLVAFPIIYWVSKDSVILLSCAYSIIISLQSLIQNYYRYNFDYNKYGKTSFIFSLTSLLALALLWRYDIEVYLLSLILINAAFLVLYKSALISIVGAFSLVYFKNNIFRLIKSSLKLFIIRLPDSYFFVYFVIVEKPNLSDTSVAVLVYLITLTAIGKYPLLRPRVQENMDIIKSYRNGAVGNSVAPIFRQLKYILHMIYGYLIVEIIYVKFVAEAMFSIISYFPLLVGYVLLIIWRYNANAAIELKENILFKIIPASAGIAIHIVLLQLSYGDYLFRFFVGGYVYLVLYFIMYILSNRDLEKGSIRLLWFVIFLSGATWLLDVLSPSVIHLGVGYFIFCLVLIFFNYKSYIAKLLK